MTRLIDADALPRYGKRKGLIKAADVDKAPTVDAMPVVHGAWRSTEGLYTNGICYCSVCETEYYFSDLYDVGEEAQSRLPNFCPHCGAMMNWEEVATDNAKMDGES